MAGAKVAFKVLKDLGEEKTKAVDEMLRRGIVASQVATVIQEEWHLLAGAKHDTIKKMLERYRKSELREKVVNEIAGATSGMRASTLQKKSSAMDSLQELVDIQTSRFKKMLMREQAAPLLLKQVSDEGRLLKEMLVELGRLQLETGVLHRVPKRVSGSVVDAQGQVSTFEWTQEQEELFKSIGGEQGNVQLQH